MESEARKVMRGRRALRWVSLLFVVGWLIGVRWLSTQIPLAWASLQTGVQVKNNAFSIKLRPTLTPTATFTLTPTARPQVPRTFTRLTTPVAMPISTRPLEPTATRTATRVIVESLPSSTATISRTVLSPDATGTRTSTVAATKVDLPQIRMPAPTRNAPLTGITKTQPTISVSGRVTATMPATLSPAPPRR